MQGKNSLISFHIYVPQSFETSESRAVCTEMNTNEFIFSHITNRHTLHYFHIRKKTRYVCKKVLSAHVISRREILLRK